MPKLPRINNPSDIVKLFDLESKTPAELMKWTRNMIDDLEVKLEQKPDMKKEIMVNLLAIVIFLHGAVEHNIRPEDI